MKLALVMIVFILLCLPLFARDVIYITDFENKSKHEIEWMLDSELHTVVGKKEYVDLRNEQFNLLLTILGKNEAYVTKLESQLETVKKTAD